MTRASRGDDLVVLVRGDNRRLARLLVLAVAPYRLRLEAMGRSREAESPSLFDALTSLRRDLDSTGWLPAVQGARRDAYPVTGDPTMVWTHAMGGTPRPRDGLGVLAPVEDVSLLATVAQQAAAFRSWKS